MTRTTLYHHEFPLSGSGNPDYDNLMRRLERIDLLLQQHYQQQGANPLETFLLPPGEVLERLSSPAGAPVWANSEGTSGDLSPAAFCDDRFSQLVERFELTEFEASVLLLGLLPHFDSRYHALFTALQGDKRKDLPCFELALTLFCRTSHEKLAQHASFLPQSPLLKCCLLQTTEARPGQFEDWGQTAFQTASTIFHHLLGDCYFSPRLMACLKRVTVPEHLLEEGDSLTFLDPLFITDEADDIAETNRVVVLRGRQGSGRAQAVALAAHARGRETLQLDIEKLPESDEAALQLCTQAFRNARLSDACLILRAFSELADERKGLLNGLSQQLDQPGLTVVCLMEPHSPPVWLHNISQLLLEMPELSTAEKEKLLSRGLSRYPLGEDVEVAALSRRFNFTPETLPVILHEADRYQQLRDPDDVMTQADIQKALLLRSQQNFGKLARRISPQRKLDDLIISPELQQQLKEIGAAIKHREAMLAAGFAKKVGYGTGISALFYGPSGTGKTLAAEVLAAAQGVDLVKIDLSTVVNKYIGETEKNLSRIFDLAEADAGVLFFDEADALFGKRSETKDAKDRHANIEVSYLLQRLENYPGLVILATNNRNHLDDAFSRRLTFITRFSYPDMPLREQMWRSIWPEGIQLEENIDFNYLAQRGDITGANIRNVALLSAWMAADEDNIVTLNHIELALKREMAKSGRLML